MTVATASRRLNPWIYVLAAPILVLMAVSLIRDPARVGQASSVSGDVAGVLKIGVVLTAILVGVWVLSQARFRTAVLVAQIGALWVGGLLYASGVRTEVTGWDIAEDAFFLITTVAQLIPGRDGSGGSSGD